MVNGEGEAGRRREEKRKEVGGGYEKGVGSVGLKKKPTIGVKECGKKNATSS
jgi:hypothetical protein